MSIVLTSGQLSTLRRKVLRLERQANRVVGFLAMVEQTYAESSESSSSEEPPAKKLAPAKPEPVTDEKTNCAPSELKVEEAKPPVTEFIVK